MEGIRIQGQTRRPQPATAVYCAVSTANRLANLVRSDGVPRRISMDTAFRLETLAQRSRHALTPGQQSISQRAATLYPRATLSLPICAAERPRLVETRIN